MAKPIIRRLEKNDLYNGFLETLNSLRETSIDKARADKIFDAINSNNNCIIVVAQLDGIIVGSATLIVEQKFIHNGGLVGHIEDVVVDKKFQGQKIGAQIISFLLKSSKDRGCYKTILDCADDIKPFYEKLGFVPVANQMRYDH